MRAEKPLTNLGPDGDLPVRRRRVPRVALMAVVAAVVFVVVASLVWPDVIPAFGHPRGDEALVGAWEGDYSGRECRLSLHADHTFVLEVRPSSLTPMESSGHWEYSDGTLRLSPGLNVSYDVEALADKGIERPELEFKVRNTILPWERRISDVEGTLLYRK